jgi:glycosyltransferase involved in cell wall biosynthesis
VNLAFISASQVPSQAANSLQVMKVCQAYAQLGHQVCLMVPGKQPVSWGILSSHYGLQTHFNIEWIPSAPVLRRYDLAWAAVRQARRKRVDAVYTWMLQAASLARWHGLPFLLELHDRVTGRVGPFLFRRLLHSRVKGRFLPITRALQQTLERDFNFNFIPDEVEVSPDGVDLERYADPWPDAAQARQILGLAQGLTVGYTGHLYAGRGMELLVALAQTQPEVNFLWVGGRPEDVADWRGRLAAGAGPHNIHLTGFIPNARLPLYQAAADILVMPYGKVVATSSGGNTVNFASPMKMFEYMACGRAILSSDLPVLHEVLNLRNAVFCPPDDFSAWQVALADLLANPERRRSLSEQARLDAAGYTWQARSARAIMGFSQKPMGFNQNRTP